MEMLQENVSKLLQLREEWLTQKDSITESNNFY